MTLIRAVIYYNAKRPIPGTSEATRRADSGRSIAQLSPRPSTAKHLADLRARSGLTTEQLIYAGRAGMAHRAESGARLRPGLAIWEDVTQTVMYEASCFPGG